ncbi:MAG: M23 family metallopeptidase [Pseudomonadota bacterium]
MWIALLVLLMWPTAELGAEPLGALELPIDCEPGVDCWILRYVDHDPGPGARDYACGKLTGDGHKGTDFALADFAVMADGVEVRAAAAGIVDALRDGMPDVGLDQGAEAVADKTCGNGIRLDHGGGWTTWYCHLRRGSLMVRKGDRVAAGQPLGLVGYSGETTFPHLHFDVRHEGQAVDPFAPDQGAEDCGVGDRPLWSAQALRLLDYLAPVVTSIGVATARPESTDVRRGWHRSGRLSATSPALVVFADINWLDADDRIGFRLRGPGGEVVVERVVTMERSWPRWFGFAGTPRPQEGWPSGRYVAELSLERPPDAARVLAERVIEVAPGQAMSQ